VIGETRIRDDVVENLDRVPGLELWVGQGVALHDRLGWIVAESCSFGRRVLVGAPLFLPVARIVFLSTLRFALLRSHF
jgi:hypothetical protein